MSDFIIAVLLITIGVFGATIYHTYQDKPSTTVLVQYEGLDAKLSCDANKKIVLAY